jgi:hypothetical protein
MMGMRIKFCRVLCLRTIPSSHRPRQFYALGTVDTATDVADASVDYAVEVVSADLKAHLSGVRDFLSLGGHP